MEQNFNTKPEEIEKWNIPEGLPPLQRALIEHFMGRLAFNWPETQEFAKKIKHGEDPVSAASDLLDAYASDKNDTSNNNTIVCVGVEVAYTMSSWISIISKVNPQKTIELPPPYYWREEIIRDSRGGKSIELASGYRLQVGYPRREGLSQIDYTNLVSRPGRTQTMVSASAVLDEPFWYTSISDLYANFSYYLDLLEDLTRRSLFERLHNLFNFKEVEPRNNNKINLEEKKIDRADDSEYNPDLEEVLGKMLKRSYGYNNTVFIEVVEGSIRKVRFVANNLTVDTNTVGKVSIDRKNALIFKKSGRGRVVATFRLPKNGIVIVDDDARMPMIVRKDDREKPSPFYPVKKIERYAADKIDSVEDSEVKGHNPFIDFFNNKGK